MLVGIELDLENSIKQYLKNSKSKDFIREIMKYVSMMVNVACVLNHLRTVNTQISLHICPNHSDSSFVSC